jgi:hypothetical protein
MRAGFAPAWRLRHLSKSKQEFIGPLKPRLLSDDMVGLKEAAIAGLGITALPGYVCRQEVRAGSLRRVLPSWVADDTTVTALIPYRQGLLPAVRVFLDHLAAEFPKAILCLFFANFPGAISTTPLTSTGRTLPAQDRQWLGDIDAIRQNSVSASRVTGSIESCVTVSRAS